jgi:hypothetical protein
MPKPSKLVNLAVKALEDLKAIDLKVAVRAACRGPHAQHGDASVASDATFRAA